MALFENPDVEITPVWSDDVVARARPLTPEAKVTDPVFIPQVILDDVPGGGWRPFDTQFQTFVGLVTEIVEDLSRRFLASNP
jgi:hypothetical protein